MTNNIPTIESTKVLKKLLVFALIFLPVLSFSQMRSQYWKKFKHEIYFGGGATAYLGDLGGGAESGNHSLNDLNLEATKYAASAGFRLKITQLINLRVDLTYALVSGADSLTPNLGRQSRNLSFKTTLYTFSPIIEVYFLPENYGRGASPISAYAATGIRLIYFNPQAELDGTWHDLQPLGTEGQLSSAGQTTYDKFTVGLPLIFGVKYALPSARGGKSGAWTIGLETSATWLMTDYLDDVSTSYANPEGVANAGGEIALALADRRATPGTQAGGIRGNPAFNDWYGMVQVFIGKKLYSQPKRKNANTRDPRRSTYF